MNARDRILRGNIREETGAEKHYLAQAKKLAKTDKRATRTMRSIAKQEKSHYTRLKKLL